MKALRGDEGAVFPVFEAVLVAVLILTTILFFTSLQRPTTATDAGGIDLGRLASDTLDILQTKEFTGGGCLTDAGLDEWVNQTLQGDECAADEVEDFLVEVLPPGTRFVVRLDNGVEPLPLVPFASTDEPRAARAAETYIVPIWRAYRDAALTDPTPVYPGQQVTVGSAPAAYAFTTTVACIEAPNSSAMAPDGQTWMEHWRDGQVAGQERIPADIPYGVWAGFAGAESGGECPGVPASHVRVALPTGGAGDQGIYGIQLVVWFGA